MIYEKEYLDGKENDPNFISNNHLFNLLSQKYYPPKQFMINANESECEDANLQHLLIKPSKRSLWTYFGFDE